MWNSYYYSAWRQYRCPPFISLHSTLPLLAIILQTRAVRMTKKKQLTQVHDVVAADGTIVHHNICK